MNSSDGHFSGAGNRTIYYRYWLPEEDPKAVVLVVHGAGEHIGRYQRFAEHFAGRGFAVVGLDHPGHGQSEGTRVYVDKFDDYLETLAIFHRQVRETFPDLPLFLLGHSLGGLISSNYLLREQDDFAGCVLSGPAIKTELKPGFLQMLTISALSLLAPRSGVLQLDATGVSRDPQEVQRYLDDPLVHNGKMTARMVRELFRAMDEIQARAGEIRLPMLLLHGGADAMASPQGSSFLHEAVSSPDKTLKIYPGLYHEIFNEPEYEAVFADACNWCEERLGPQTDA